MVAEGGGDSGELAATIAAVAGVLFSAGIAGIFVIAANGHGSSLARSDEPVLEIDAFQEQSGEGP